MESSIKMQEIDKQFNSLKVDVHKQDCGSKDLSSSSIQLKQGFNDTLEAILGVGKIYTLKISMDLSLFKKSIEKELIDVPICLSLQDLSRSSYEYDDQVNTKINVKCEWTPVKCVLLPKPLGFESYEHSFESYDQFAEWLNGGYFTNENILYYDFHIDINEIAPMFIPHLYAVPLKGYHFSGSHVCNNAVIKPDNNTCIIKYSSRRGEHLTIITLSGALFLGEKEYPIDDHTQTYSHSITKQNTFKNKSKKFYNRNWIARCEETTKITYSEMEDDYDNWPGSPCAEYVILKQSLGNLEKIQHVECWNSIGENISLSDDRVFSIVHERVEDPECEWIESIVKDDNTLYTVRYYKNRDEESQSVDEEERCYNNRDEESQSVDEEEEPVKQIVKIVKSTVKAVKPVVNTAKPIVNTPKARIVEKKIMAKKRL